MSTECKASDNSGCGCILMLLLFGLLGFALSTGFKKIHEQLDRIESAIQETRQEPKP